MKRIIIFLAILFLGTSVMYGQRNFTSLQYSVGFGTGDLGKFVGNTSFRGATFDWRKYVQPNIGVGLEVGWNVFYQSNAFDSYTQGNLTLSGKQYRYQNQVPLLVSGDYFLKPGSKFNPFIGLGVGTMFSRRNTDMSMYTLQQDAWHFALRPEIGFLLEMNPETSALVALKFYNGFAAGDLKQTQSYISLNVGLAFTK